MSNRESTEGDGSNSRLRDEIRQLISANRQLEDDYKLQVKTLQDELKSVSMAANFSREDFEYVYSPCVALSLILV